MTESIRTKFNKYPVIAIAVAVVAIVTVFFVWRSTMGNSLPEGKTFYTVDDGKTYFAVDSAPISPCLHDGKEAYHVNLFKSASGKLFVGYMDRYSPEAKALIDRAGDQFFVNGMTAIPAESRSKAIEGLEVKKPGETQWKKMGSDKIGMAMYIHAIKAPDGSEATLLGPFNS